MIYFFTTFNRFGVDSDTATVYKFTIMTHRAFTIRLPEEIARLLDEEARDRYFKTSGRTQLLIEILLDRYREQLKDLKQPRRSRKRAEPALDSP